MRLNLVKVLILALIGSFATAQSPIPHDSQVPPEPWRSSWTAFAQATKDFLEDEISHHPNKPEFPRAGSVHLSMGEFTKSDLPVMKRFKGPLVFKGTLTEIVTKPTPTNQLMPGQAFKLGFEMVEPGVRGWLGNPKHVYPKADALEKWRAIPLGTVVTFRTKLGGIGAVGMDGKYFCMVLLTEAEPLDAK